MTLSLRSQARIIEHTETGVTFLESSYAMDIFVGDYQAFSGAAAHTARPVMSLTMYSRENFYFCEFQNF